MPAFCKKIILSLALIAFAANYSSVLQGKEPAGQKKICLTMIVKNESRIIERCLDSVKDIVDCISISDTGSTDNTVELIESYLKKNNIPGKVHSHPWKNFGHNRTLSLQAAQKTLKDLDFPMAQTYLLLLDADMLLKKGPEFNKSDLIVDAYLITQKNTNISYDNVRLVRASLPWKSVGVTHEYWSCNIPNQQTNLKTLSIDDREDGGSKSDKFERDIKLLTQGLKDEPDNERYMFYLAQSYHCNGQHAEAIPWYKARIEKGGWKEEVWFSKFMIGECHEELNDWDQALHWYLDAYQYFPERAESLQSISKHYCSKEQYELAYLFAKLGSRIPYPENCRLFVYHQVYNYQFDETLSIASYYTRFKEEGFAAAERLAHNKKAPSHVKDQAYRNMLHYVSKLKNTNIKPIEIKLPPIREDSELRYNPMNPSIQKTENGYTLICRTVNYTQIGAKEFPLIDPEDKTGTIRTKNFLVEYDKNFNLLSQHEIVENLPRQKIKHYNIEGLEDCRLCRINDENWFTATTCDTNPTGIHQISLCKLEDNATGDVIQVEKLIPLKGPNPYRCEKNWLPFVKDNKIHLVYSYDPFVLYMPNTATGECETVLRYDTLHDLTRFSGSAAPIEFDHGYLMLVHMVTYTDQRYYLHRFVYLDKNFKIRAMSKPFIFTHKGIEYCCSLTMDHTGKQLVMPIGIEDREAYLLSVDLNTVRSMLEPLPLSAPKK